MINDGVAIIVSGPKLVFDLGRKDAADDERSRVDRGVRSFGHRLDHPDKWLEPLEKIGPVVVELKGLAINHLVDRDPVDPPRDVYLIQKSASSFGMTRTFP